MQNIMYRGSSSTPADNSECTVALSMMHADCHVPERAHVTSPPIVARTRSPHSVTEKHKDDKDGRMARTGGHSSPSSPHRGARDGRSDPSTRDHAAGISLPTNTPQDDIARESSPSSPSEGADRSMSDPSPRQHGADISLPTDELQGDVAIHNSSSSLSECARCSRSDPLVRHDENEISVQADSPQVDVAAHESSSSSSRSIRRSMNDSPIKHNSAETSLPSRGTLHSKGDLSLRHDENEMSLPVGASLADAVAHEASSASAAPDKTLPARSECPRTGKPSSRVKGDTPASASSSLVASVVESTLPTLAHTDTDGGAQQVQCPHRSSLADTTSAVCPCSRSSGSTTQPSHTSRQLMSSFLPACQPSLSSSTRASREPSTSSEGRANNGRTSGAMIAASAVTASQSPTHSRSHKSPRGGDGASTPSLAPLRTRSPEGAINTKADSPHQNGNGMPDVAVNFEREVSLLVAEKLALQEEVARLKKEQDGAAAHHISAPSTQSPCATVLSSAPAVAKWDIFLGASKEVIQNGLDRTRSKVAEVVDNLQKNPFQVGTICEVMERGAVVRAFESLDSAKVTFLPQGVLVKIEEINGRRARVKSDKTEGWLSVTSTQGRQLLRYRPDLNVGAKVNEADAAEARAAMEDSFVAVSQDDLVALHKRVQRLTVDNAAYKEENEKAHCLARNLAEKVKLQEAELRQSFEWQTEVRKLKSLLASERRATASLTREHECMLHEDARSGCMVAREQQRARDKAERDKRALLEASAVPDAPALTAIKEAPTEEPSRACDSADEKNYETIMEGKLRDLEVQYSASQRKMEKEIVVLRQTLKQLGGPKTNDESSNWLYLARIADLEQKVEEFRRKAVLHVPTAKMLSRYLESQASVHCFNVLGSKASRECDLKGLVEEVLQENLRLLAEQSTVVERTDAL